MPEKEARTGAPANPPVSMPDRTTLIAFGALVILGGGASISMGYSYGELAPFWSGVLMPEKKVVEASAEEDILARPGLPTCV